MTLTLGGNQKGGLSPMLPAPHQKKARLINGLLLN